ncbi:MAG: MFS transporter, partial [Planctomycetota bacterium]
MNDAPKTAAPAAISPARRALAIGTLILAGEAIFIPPFHPGRYFRTTILDAFGINEVQLGEAQAWYGIVAMLCYGLGGPLADRVGPRLLMSASLVATGMGSLYMATIPSLLGLKCLFAFWGASTIFAFWAPLIRTTRELGGDLSQGRAFGVLDGGRGLVAWAIAAASAWAVGGSLAAGADGGAIETLMYAYATVTAAVAVVVWFGLPPTVGAGRRDAERVDSRDVFRLLREPAIWLMGVVVLTAYCAFKTFDFYGHYSEDIYGLTKAQSATLTAWLTFLRAVAAVGAGLLADRFFGSARAVLLSFGLLGASFAALYEIPPTAGWWSVALANMAIAWSASCALRGVYFAL